LASGSNTKLNQHGKKYVEKIHRLGDTKVSAEENQLQRLVAMNSRPVMMSVSARSGRLTLRQRSGLVLAASFSLANRPKRKQ
jgi:hypothetical protein